MSQLFAPQQVGTCQLQHRISVAPRTRRRVHDDYTASDVMMSYYAQRASIPGPLLISEAVATSPRAAVWQNTSGIYTPEQIARWRPIVEAVHARGSFIFCQLWITGHAVRPLAVAAGAEVVSSSDVPWSPEEATPRPSREAEIWACIEDFEQAAVNVIAINGACTLLVLLAGLSTTSRLVKRWKQVRDRIVS